jgi:hypothetical protein
MTQMELRIVAYANKMGYFPDAKQASVIWEHWCVYMSELPEKVAKQTGNSDEVYDASMRSSIEKVMKPTDSLPH